MEEKEPEEDGGTRGEWGEKIRALSRKLDQTTGSRKMKWLSAIAHVCACRLHYRSLFSHGWSGWTLLGVASIAGHGIPSLTRLASYKGQKVRSFPLSDFLCRVDKLGLHQENGLCWSSSFCPVGYMLLWVAFKIVSLGYRAN